MQETDRTVPPRQGRIAHAAREGLFSHSAALLPGATLLAAAVLIDFRGPEGVASLSVFFKDSLTHAVATREAPGELLMESLVAGARLIVPVLLVVFVAGAIATLAPVLWARRHRGRTAVPLPDKPQPKIVLTTIRATGAVIFLLLSFKILRDAPWGWSTSPNVNFAQLAEVGQILQKLLFAGGAMLLLVALVELSVMRTEILRALRLNSLESRREERSAGGDPAVKGEARRRGRRAWRRGRRKAAK